MSIAKRPPEVDQALREFQLEMASSYWDAVRALGEFQGRVESVCSNRLREHLPALSSALGKRVARATVKPHSYADSDVISLGAKALVGDAGGLYVVVVWEEAETGKIGIGINCTLWLRDGRAAKAFWDSVKRLGSKKTILGSNEIWLTEPIVASEFPQLEERMESLLVEWERILQKVGPLRELL